MTKPAHPDLPPKCEVCQENLAVGPLTCICSACYTDLAPRIAGAAQFRSPPGARPYFRGHYAPKVKK